MPPQFCFARINSVRKLTATDDDPWDAFLVDDDEQDPLPEPGDFWPDEEVEEPRFTNRQPPLAANARKEFPCCH